MPNLNIYLLEGFSALTRRRLLTRMTDAVVETLGVPEVNIRLFLFELPRAQVCVGGVTLDEMGEEAVQLAGPTVHAFLVAGRSDAQKQALIVGLSEVCQEVLEIPATPVRIMIVDVPNTSFGMQGRTAKSLGR